MIEFGKYLESILHLFEYLIIFYIFSQIFEKRFKSEYASYGIIIIIVCLNVSAELLWGLNSMMSSVVKLSSLFIALMLLFRSKILNTLMIFIVSFIALTLCDFIAISIAAFVFRQEGFGFVAIGYNRIFLGIFSKFIFLIVGQIIVSRFKSVPVVNPRNLYQLLMVLLLNTAFIVLVTDIYFQNRRTFSMDIGFVFTVLTGVMVISLLMIKFTENIIDYSKKERDWQLQEEEYRRQIFYMNHLEDINTQMKAIRHDFNHHISCLQGMLEHGEIASAKEYTSELVNEAEQFNVAFSTKHAGISGLLSSKYQLLRSNDIPMLWSVDLPDKLNVKLIDVSIVLGNALDNAIEACKKTPVDERFIELKMYEEMNNIVIKIKNNFDQGSINENFATTKLDRDRHGYGLKNIKFVVDKYDGYFDVNIQDNVFNLNVALPNG